MRAAILLFVCLPAFAVAQTPATQIAANQTPANPTPVNQTQSSKGEAASRQRRGYVFYEGRWRLPQEIVYLQRADSLRLAGVVPATPANDKPPALAAKLAAPRKQPKLPRSTTTGLFTIRMQHVELLGMDTVPVSVGTGTVRLQLPRTQVVSIGTTVGLPLR